MEEIQQQIQKHLEAAYALLPSALESPYPDPKRDDLKEKYEDREWLQVFYLLETYSKINNFSAELLHHLKAAGELFNLYDSLGMRAALEHLTDEEKRTIGQCLRAAAFGPFFPDWEFSILFGVEREEAIRIAEAWPKVKETDTNAGLTVNNSINNLFGYPHGKNNEWANYISEPPERVCEIYNKFRALMGWVDNQQIERTEYFYNIE